MAPCYKDELCWIGRGGSTFEGFYSLFICLRLFWKLQQRSVNSFLYIFGGGVGEVIRMGSRGILLKPSSRPVVHE